MQAEGVSIDYLTSWDIGARKMNHVVIYLDTPLDVGECKWECSHSTHPYRYDISEFESVHKGISMLEAELKSRYPKYRWSFDLHNAVKRTPFQTNIIPKLLVIIHVDDDHQQIFTRIELLPQPEPKPLVPQPNPTAKPTYLEYATRSLTSIGRYVICNWAPLTITAAASLFLAESITKK